MHLNEYLKCSLFLKENGCWLFPPLVWFVFLIWMLRLQPLGASRSKPPQAASLLSQEQAHRASERNGSSVLFQLVVCAISPLFSDIIGYKPQPDVHNAVLEGGEQEQKQHGTDLKTPLDFSCVAKTMCILKLEKSPHTPPKEKTNQ